MIELLLDDTGDLAFSEGNLGTATSDIGLAQRLRIALRIFKGEWWVDKTVGIPYFENKAAGVKAGEVVFDKPLNPELLDAVFKSAILGVFGVAELLEFEITNNRAARTLTVDFTVRADDDEVVSITEVLP